MSELAGLEVRRPDLDGAQLRLDILAMAANSGHVAAALSCVDIIAALYGDVLNCSPSVRSNPHRDRFILSKGHGAMALYAVLARSGYFPPAWLQTYVSEGSVLAEHPLQAGLPGVEVAAGSLGHGLGIGLGIAEGLRIQGSSASVYVLLGDGECNEGSIWEAAALARSRRLANLVAIVDFNGLQACGAVSEISEGADLAGLWASSGWDVVEVDGHDAGELASAIRGPMPDGRPRVVLARTVKGKGVPMMEGDLEWHYRPVRGSEAVVAVASMTCA